MDHATCNQDGFPAVMHVLFLILGCTGAPWLLGSHAHRRVVAYARLPVHLFDNRFTILHSLLAARTAAV